MSGSLVTGHGSMNWQHMYYTRNYWIDLKHSNKLTFKLFHQPKKWFLACD